MHRILPPLCLLLALAMVIAAFALWATGPPEASVELHRATAAGDEAFRERFEADLESQKLRRKLMIGGLFAGSAVAAAMAFITMRPAERERPDG